MFRTLIAKFPGTCKRCGLAFEAGAKIRYGGRGRTYHFKADCSAVVDSTASTIRYYGGDVETFEIGGNVFTRNAKGRCEDAPCCGCCTI